MTHNYNVAILGTGFGKLVHIPAFQLHPNFTVTTIVGRDEKKTKAVAEAHKIANWSTDWQSVLRQEDVDVVSIATPPFSHKEIALKAFENGLHVLCEKNLGISIEEAEEMAISAKDSGLIAMINYIFRFIPERVHLVNLINNGYLGEISHFNISIQNSSRLNPRKKGFNWWSEQKLGGGILNSLGSHYIDMLCQIFPISQTAVATLSTNIPRRLNKSTGRMKKVNSDDIFSGILEIDEKTHGTLQMSSISPFGKGLNMEFYGSEGSLVMDSNYKLFGAKLGTNNALEELELPAYFKGLEINIKDKNHLVQPMYRLVNELNLAITQGKSLHPNFQDALAVQKVITAFQESTRKKKKIQIT